MSDELENSPRLDAIERAVHRIEYLLTQVATGEHPRRNRAADRAAQQLLALRYRELAASGVVPELADTESKFFSQNGEDGILVFLLALVGARSRRAVEICAGDGIECNTANLVVNHGFEALMVDGGDDILKRGGHFYTTGLDTWFWPPTLVKSWVTAESVNDLVREHKFDGEIDVLSLDMDGVDYWVWKALDCVTPRIVVLEYNPALGPDVSYAVPYDPGFSLAERTEGGDHRWHFGASLSAYVKLARAKGLRLVGTQRYGFNAFFIRHDLAPVLPEVEPASCFTHPAVLAGIKDLAPVRDELKWVEV